MTWIEEIEKRVRGVVLPGEPMAGHTTFRIGGPCSAFCEPADSDDLVAALAFLRSEGIPHVVMGQGSNLLFSDRGYEGCVIHMGTGVSGVEVDGGRVSAGAGVLLHSLVVDTAGRGMAGLESLAGIPGTVGGSVWMNAGAFESRVSEPMESVEIISEEGELQRLGKSELEFGYRRSIFQDRSGWVILSARFDLGGGDPDALKKRIGEILDHRRDKQPLEMPSAGSFFRNPDGGPAGRLIDRAGLKGLRVGGAEVSNVHANFIVNAGGATCADVRMLADMVMKKVSSVFNVDLLPEVRFID